MECWRELRKEWTVCRLASQLHSAKGMCGLVAPRGSSSNGAWSGVTCGLHPGSGSPSVSGRTPSGSPGSDWFFQKGVVGTLLLQHETPFAFLPVDAMLVQGGFSELAEQSTASERKWTPLLVTWLPPLLSVRSWHCSPSSGNSAPQGCTVLPEASVSLRGNVF